MTDAHRPKHDEKSDRILVYLHEQRGKFEAEGVSEKSLASAVGLSEEEVTEAVDRLENREAVVRISQHDAPGSFLLQPARGWPDIRDGLGKGTKA